MNTPSPRTHAHTHKFPSHHSALPLLSPCSAVDVAAWGVDFYGVSLHKAYGPHLGALFMATGAAQELTGQNHPFVEVDDWPRKFELGSLPSEACAGVEALQVSSTLLLRAWCLSVSNVFCVCVSRSSLD